MWHQIASKTNTMLFGLCLCIVLSSIVSRYTEGIFCAVGLGTIFIIALADIYLISQQFGNKITVENTLSTTEEQELIDGINRYTEDNSYRFETCEGDPLYWRKHDMNIIFEAATSSQRLKKELIRNVAHEIKTPLTSIKLMTEGLEDGIFTVDDGMSLKQISDSVQRLDETLSMMSRYVSSGAAGLEGETSDLASCLIAAYEKAQVLAQSHNVKVSLKEEIQNTSPIIVNMSAASLNLALDSIISNAFEHAHGMENLTLSFADEPVSHTGTHMARFSISDDGCGAPENMAYKMCEPFWKNDDSHTLAEEKTSSPGLGLSVVKEMVASRGGELDITCAEGQGTCVSVWLPVGA